MDTPPLITSAEACELLGLVRPLDRSTLSRWVQQGRITPAHKLPGLRGAFLFDPAEVARVREDLEQAQAS